LRALVLPDTDETRSAAAEPLAEHPEWYEGLPSAALLEMLSHAPAPENPLDAAPDAVTRTLLAEALNSAADPTEEGGGGSRQTPQQQIHYALRSLRQRHLERRQRELRGSIAEAERRGDQAMVSTLLRERIGLDRSLRELESAED
jgi:DNA primase